MVGSVELLEVVIHITWDTAGLHVTGEAELNRYATCLHASSSGSSSVRGSISAAMTCLQPIVPVTETSVAPSKRLNTQKLDKWNNNSSRMAE